jgi:hypothetical protein
VTDEKTDILRGFYKGWTGNGKKLVASISGSNFYTAGGNRKRCSIIRPDDMKRLLDEGILTPVPGGYRFIPEVKK